MKMIFLTRFCASGLRKNWQRIQKLAAISVNL
jgi:hypothetical protein